MKRILIVDDEPYVLSGIKRQVRKMRNEWHVTFATNALQALDFLAIKPVDVVVTDIRMPGMNGVELILKIHESYPNTLPIVLSGQCSTSDAVSLKKAGIHFISKPCEPETLYLYIERALNTSSQT